MTKWVLKGLRTGIVTTTYPDREETAPGVSPGFPEIGPSSGSEPATDCANCPAAALTSNGEGVSVDYRRCIHCFRCLRGETGPATWREGYQWAVRRADPADETPALTGIFRKSLHIRVVDAGACGACLSEIEQLNKPYYNMHRLGFFLTPTPREADVLLVAGPGTNHMRLALEKTYEAMPTPKKVIAVGACALSGGVFGPSFASGAGVPGEIPVEVAVPGCPPPPLAIIHGLLVLVGRKPPATASSSSPVLGGR